jgi:hypothetical protein
MSFRKVKIMPSLKHYHKRIFANNGYLFLLFKHETSVKYNFLNNLIHNNETILNKGERNL